MLSGELGLMLLCGYKSESTTMLRGALGLVLLCGCTMCVHYNSARCVGAGDIV